MNYQITNFCELIKNVIHPERESQLSEQVNWSYLVQLAKDHNLLAVFLEGAIKHSTYTARHEYGKEMNETLAIVGAQVRRTNAFLRLYEAFSKEGIYVAAQCCEHLNRALIIERACAAAYGLEPVCVIPQPKAGGSFATAAWHHFAEPVAVEHIRAHAGLDIGGTLIGMHLREVAVPVRLSVKSIGAAPILCARTRPKFIGGVRAAYDESKL